MGAHLGSLKGGGLADILLVDAPLEDSCGCQEVGGYGKQRVLVGASKCFVCYLLFVLKW